MQFAQTRKCLNRSVCIDGVLCHVDHLTCVAVLRLDGNLDECRKYPQDDLQPGEMIYNADVCNDSSNSRLGGKLRCQKLKTLPRGTRRLKTTNKKQGTNAPLHSNQKNCIISKSSKLRRLRLHHWKKRRYAFSMPNAEITLSIARMKPDEVRVLCQRRVFTAKSLQLWSRG